MVSWQFISCRLQKERAEKEKQLCP